MWDEFTGKQSCGFKTSHSAAGSPVTIPNTSRRDLLSQPPSQNTHFAVEKARHLQYKHTSLAPFGENVVQPGPWRHPGPQQPHRRECDTDIPISLEPGKAAGLIQVNQRKFKNLWMA